MPGNFFSRGIGTGGARGIGSGGARGIEASSFGEQSTILVRPTRTVGVQVKPRSADNGTQIGEGYVHGALYRMLHSTKSTQQIEDNEEQDPLEKAMGEFGRWQFQIQFILFICNIMYVFQLVVADWTSLPEDSLFCARPSNLVNLSINEWKQFSGIYKKEIGVIRYDPCFKKDIDYSAFDTASVYTILENNATNNFSGKIHCTSWEYIDHYSLVSEWDLPCVVPNPTRAAESAFAVGGIMGSVLSGYLIDRKGRRMYLLWSQLANTFISFITALSPKYYLYLIFRGLQGFFTIGCNPSLCILSMEVCGKSWIGIVSSTFMYSFPAAYLSGTMFAGNVMYWRHLHYTITFISLLILTVFWVLPESPRWLWVQKKYNHLLKVIEEASNINGRAKLHPKDLSKLKTTGPMLIPLCELEVKISDLFRTQVIRKQTMVVLPLFFLTFLAYYGSVLRVNTVFDAFDANIFTSFVEITAVSISLSILSRSYLNDASMLFFSSISAGIFFLLIQAFSDSDYLIVFVIGARFCMAIMNTNLSSYIAQLYPTSMRGLAICTANGFAFIALLATANIAAFEAIRQGLFLFLMGMSGFIAGFMILLLPTLPLDYNRIPDTVMEVEKPFSNENVLYGHKVTRK